MFGATRDGRVVIADTAFRFHSAPPRWAKTTYDLFVTRARMFARPRMSARSWLKVELRTRPPCWPLCAVRVYLENDHGVSDAHELFHARGIPVGEANTPVAGSAANCLRIIRAVNTDAGFVQTDP